MALIPVTGFDPSMNNWGVASGFINTADLSIQIDTVTVINPVKPKGKQVRQNSKDLEVAKQLAQGAFAAVQAASVVFVEVPVGSKSSRAMASYGICVGVLGAMRAQGKSFFEVNPQEVKLAAVNDKTATKKQMIDWAYGLYPDAPWPTYTKEGEILLTEAKAEHIADAIATIHAGIQLDSFKQLTALLAA